MVNMLHKFEERKIQELGSGKNIPEFGSGDTIEVILKIGDRQSTYTGICIGRRNRGLNSSFTVRKISFGVGVEKVISLYSPSLLGVKVIKRGKVRQSKIYYLRDLSGKSARIAEATSGYKSKLNKRASEEAKQESLANRAKHKKDSRNSNNANQEVADQNSNSEAQNNN